MGLTVATIKQVLLCLSQPCFVEWNYNVTFDKMLHKMKNFPLVWSTGMKICLM